MANLEEFFIVDEDYPKLEHWPNGEECENSFVCFAEAGNSLAMLVEAATAHDCSNRSTFI